MSMYLIIASRNLLQSRRRTFLLGLALAMVTLLLVMLLALSQGISDTMVGSATALSSGHINVAGFYKTTPTDTAPIVNEAGKLKAIVKEVTPEAVSIIDRQRGWARVISDQTSINSGLSGIDLSQEQRLLASLQLAEEREYKEGGRDQVIGDLQKLREKNQALIFVAQAKRLGVEVGDALTITIETLRGYTNTVEFTVAAIARDMGMLSSWSLFVSRETILGLYDLTPDSTGAVMVYLDDISQSKEVMTALVTRLEDKGYQVMDHDSNPFWMKFDTVTGEDWVGQKLDLTIWKDEVNFLTWVLTAVDVVSMGLLGILVGLIAIGIMNAMWIAVKERTREVGTVRAIGMSRRRVLMLFMTEALLLGLGATTIGATCGAAIALGIDAAAIKVPIEAMHTILMSDTIHMAVRPVQIVFAIVGFTVLTGLSALWPALRASRLEPVTAIHHVQ
jgi:putative ABC transport system permease protein